MTVAAEPPGHCRLVSGHDPCGMAASIDCTALSFTDFQRNRVGPATLSGHFPEFSKLLRRVLRATQARRACWLRLPYRGGHGLCAATIAAMVRCSN